MKAEKRLVHMITLTLEAGIHSSIQNLHKHTAPYAGWVLGEAVYVAELLWHYYGHFLC